MWLPFGTLGDAPLVQTTPLEKHLQIVHHRPYQPLLTASSRHLDLSLHRWLNYLEIRIVGCRESSSDAKRTFTHDTEAIVAQSTLVGSGPVTTHTDESRDQLDHAFPGWR